MARSIWWGKQTLKENSSVNNRIKVKHFPTENYFESRNGIVEKMGHSRPIYVSFFSSKFYTAIIGDFSRTQTRIVGFEGDNADHMTTTPCPKNISIYCAKRKTLIFLTEQSLVLCLLKWIRPLKPRRPPRLRPNRKCHRKRPIKDPYFQGKDQVSWCKQVD